MNEQQFLAALAEIEQMLAKYPTYALILPENEKVLFQKAVAYRKAIQTPSLEEAMALPAVLQADVPEMVATKVAYHLDGFAISLNKPVNGETILVSNPNFEFTVTPKISDLKNHKIVVKFVDIAKKESPFVCALAKESHYCNVNLPEKEGIYWIELLDNKNNLLATSNEITLISSSPYLAQHPLQLAIERWKNFTEKILSKPDLLSNSEVNTLENNQELINKIINLSKLLNEYYGLFVQLNLLENKISKHSGCKNIEDFVQKLRGYKSATTIGGDGSITRSFSVSQKDKIKKGIFNLPCKTAAEQTKAEEVVAYCAAYCDILPTQAIISETHTTLSLIEEQIGWLEARKELLSNAENVKKDQDDRAKCPVALQAQINELISLEKEIREVLPNLPAKSPFSAKLDTIRDAYSRKELPQLEKVISELKELDVKINAFAEKYKAMKEEYERIAANKTELPIGNTFGKLFNQVVYNYESLNNNTHWKQKCDELNNYAEDVQKLLSKVREENGILILDTYDIDIDSKFLPPVNPEKNGDKTTHVTQGKLDDDPFVSTTLAQGDKNNTQKISPDDIDQGGLGDCYFLASVASLAQTMPDIFLEDTIEDKDFIIKPIYTGKTSSKGVKEIQKVNGYSIYEVSLNVSVAGVITPLKVRVTDEFVINKVTKPHKDPSGNDTGMTDTDIEPLFAQAKGETKKEIWVLLLEKALVAIKGGYKNAEGGTPKEAMRMLLGNKASTEEVGLGNITEAELAEELTGLLDAKNPTNKKVIKSAVASSKQPAGVEVETEVKVKLKHMGAKDFVLYQKHSYTISEYDSAEKIITLRNPHAKNGQTNDGKAEERTFVMLTLSEFKEYFSYFTVVEKK